MRLFIQLFRRVSVLFCMVLFVSQSGFAQTATVMTDKADYQPGDTVHITGTGWMAGETVRLDIENWTITQGLQTLYSVASPEGDIQNDEFIIQPAHDGEIFMLTATGLTSGWSAQTMFTDGLAFSATISPTNVATSTTSSYTITITNNSTLAEALGSGRVQIPGGYSGLPPQGTTLTYSAPPGKSWNVRLGTGTNSDRITFEANAAGDVLAPGQSISFSVTVTSPSSGGNYQWTSTAFTGRNSSTGPYPAPSSQPTVTVMAAATITLSNMTQTYTGSPLTPTATTTPAGLAIVWTNAPQTNAGSYSVTATINDPNYQGSASGTFVIEKAPSVTAVTINGAPFTYTGAAITPATVSVTGAGGLNLTPTADYANNVNAGTATASYTYAGDANHTGSNDSKNFEIGKAASVTVVTINGGPFTYTGAAITPATVSVTGAGGLNLTPTADYANNVNAGTATASYTYAGDANHTGSNDSKNFEIGKATPTVTALGGTYMYDGNAHPATGQVKGVPSDGVIATPTFTYTPGGSSTPITVGDYSVVGSFAGNDNYNPANSAPATISITHATTSVVVAASTVQYSDPVTFVATIYGVNPAAQAQVNQGGTVAFSINTGTMSLVSPPGVVLDATSGVLIATGTFIITNAPGNYTVTATFTPQSGNVSGSSGNGALMVTREDAVAIYTGPEYVSTASSSSCSVTLTLSATIKDITALLDDPSYDPNAGDIRKASVRFKSDSYGIDKVVSIGLVDLSDPKIGTATTTVTINLNSSDCTNGGTSITVVAYVENHYTNASNSFELATQTITISVPGKDFVTGGGFLVMQSSAGQYKGKTGSKTNFGFTMKYNKSGRNLQGQANIIVRSDNGKMYQIKSNAINSMTATGTKANFSTKANLTDITNPLNPIAMGGNLTLLVEMNDLSTGGQDDLASFTLQDNSGGLLYSSNWDGTKSVLQLLRQPTGGGNVRVLSTATTLAKSGEEEFIPEEYALYQNYPNPFNPTTQVKYDLPEASRVSIVIYDLLGRKVLALVDGDVSAGRHIETWAAKDGYGNSVASGVYFLRIEAKSLTSERNLSSLKKMVFVK